MAWRCSGLRFDSVHVWQCEGDQSRAEHNCIFTADWLSVTLVTKRSATSLARY